MSTGDHWQLGVLFLLKRRCKEGYRGFSMDMVLPEGCFRIKGWQSDPITVSLKLVGKGWSGCTEEGRKYREIGTEDTKTYSATSLGTVNTQVPESNWVEEV